MKLNSVTALRTGLLAAVIAFPAAQAQTPPPKEKLVTRDELRVCMSSESELATRRQALEARAAQNREEAGAIRTAAEELAEEKKRVDDDPNQMRIDRFERRVKAHNTRVKAAQDKAEALRADLEAMNKSLLAHNDSCGGISFRKEDKDAILQERAGKTN